MTIVLMTILKSFELWLGFRTGFEKSILVTWRWPGKTAGGVVFALIFFASFLYQDKKEDKG